jgi:hypothetical protein
MIGKHIFFIFPPPERGRAGWGSAAEKLAQASPPRTPTCSLSLPSGRTRWLAILPFQGEVSEIYGTV